MVPSRDRAYVLQWAFSLSSLPSLSPAHHSALRPGLPAWLRPQHHLSNLYLVCLPYSPPLPQAGVPWRMADKVCAAPGEGTLQVLSFCLFEHQRDPVTLWGSSWFGSCTWLPTLDLEPPGLTPPLITHPISLPSALWLMRRNRIRGGSDALGPLILCPSLARQWTAETVGEMRTTAPQSGPQNPHTCPLTLDERAESGRAELGGVGGKYGHFKEADENHDLCPHYLSKTFLLI